MSEPAGDGDFERWLEAELRRAVASAEGPRPRPAQAAYQRARRPRRRFAAMGVLGVAAVFAALIGEAVVATATGTPNPIAWSHRVVQVVHDCQDRTDVGTCVGWLGRHWKAPPDGAAPAPTPAAVADPSPSPDRHIERSIDVRQLAGKPGPGQSNHARGNGNGNNGKAIGKIKHAGKGDDT